ncbi:MAG: formimidoylglutamate deiminase [Silicimonas sp.]|nr:formimidoylglutamate deiminase [Silicimonas sp.]
MTKLRAGEALTAKGWQQDLDIEIGPDGRIASIGPQAGEADVSVDLLLPAPVNLHSHAFQRAMAGLTEARGPDAGDSFWTWRRLMYRFLEQLTPDHAEAIAAQVFMEMAEAGYGAVAEFHYLHHGADGQPYGDLAEMSARIAAAASETGLGLTHLPVLYEFGGCDGRALQGGQRRFGNGKDQYAALHEAARGIIAEGPADWAIGVAPHSLRAVDEAGLTLARDQTGDGVFHMHLAEQVAEVEEVEAHLGARPVEWVLDNMPVDSRHCFIHCTQMTDSETDGLARTGAVAGLCPITESSLGDGIFNGTRYLGAGGTFGVGSDSNIQISLWEEAKTLEYSQRLRDRGRAMLATAQASTGRVIFDGLCKGGAQAAGRDSGALAVGGWADMIGLSTDNEFLCNRRGDALLDTLMVAGGGPAATRDVWSAGRHIVRDGRHVARDRIAARFKAVLSDLETEI